MLGMEYDRNVWKRFTVKRIKEYGRRWWRYGFGKNDREQEYLKVKNETYANGSVRARM